MSNLTAPPPIPGFEARLLFDQTPTLDLKEVYIDVIQTMALLAGRPYTQPITEAFNTLAFDWCRELLTISPWPRGTNGLQVKHAVQAVYQAGVALATKPITVPGNVPKLYAGIFLQNQQIGFLKWQHRRYLTAAGEMNGTVSLIDAANLTSAAQLSRGDEPTRLRESQGTIINPRDPKLKITYTVSDEYASLPETLTAFLDALATAATNEALSSGAFVNAASISGDIALNVHRTSMPSTFTWIHLITTLLLLWRDIVEKHYFNDIDFVIWYDESEIAQGYIWNITAPRTNVASSR